MREESEDYLQNAFKKIVKPPVINFACFLWVSMFIGIKAIFSLGHWDMIQEKIKIQYLANLLTGLPRYACFHDGNTVVKRPENEI